MTQQKFDLEKALQELEEINKWFQSDDIDLDQGLQKLKQGQELIKKCKDKITEVENELVEVKKDFDIEIEE